jgi:17beta-estradiol 17-dehydrogenase / very-long-chain 3-oxoacyl-CoA reductase
MLYWIGLLFTLSVIFRFLKWIYNWSNPLNIGRLRGDGDWAIVTGCTDGIGLAIAEELCNNGFKLLLLSRSKEKLECLRRIVPGSEIIVCDFSVGIDEVYIREKIGNKRISLLVNNIGVGYDKPKKYEQLTPREIELIVQVNITSTALITRIVASTMSKGTIMNISSGSSLSPCPYLTVYAASKAFINAWSEGLRIEYKNRIHVQCYTPYFITSKLSGYTQPTLTIPSPAQWAASALGQLGRGTTTGYIIHDMMRWVLTSLMPTSTAEAYTSTVNREDGNIEG